MKKLKPLICGMVLCAMCAAPASALTYDINAPDDYLFARPTSQDVIYEQVDINVDRSKDVALIAPGFGTPTSYLPGSGEYLTPNLVPGALSGGLVNSLTGNSYTDVPPVSTAGGGAALPGGASGSMTWGMQDNNAAGEVRYTDVTSDLYYEGGYLGTLKIPSINLNVKVYQGTDDAALKNGVGHFEETSIWAGNVALGGHNRGVNTYFGKIDTLKPGASITLTTRLGTKTYTVTSVEKISATDVSALDASNQDCITLLTCVRDQPDYRWCVRGEA